MLFFNVFIALSLVESAYSGVIMSHQNVGDNDLVTDLGIDMGIDTVEQDIDDILEQMEEDGESMLELMVEEDSEAMLEDAERVERSVGELFNRIFSLIPVPLYPQAFPVDELSLDPVGVVEYFAPASALQVRNYYEEQKSLAMFEEAERVERRRVKRNVGEFFKLGELFKRLWKAIPVVNIALGPFLSLQPLALPVNAAPWIVLEELHVAVLNTTTFYLIEKLREEDRRKGLMLEDAERVERSVPVVSSDGMKDYS